MDSVARVRKKSPVLIPVVGVREVVDRRRTEELLADADADAVEVIVEPARPTQVRQPEPLRRRLRREPYFGEICWFRNESRKVSGSTLGDFFYFHALHLHQFVTRWHG